MPEIAHPMGLSFADGEEGVDSGFSIDVGGKGASAGGQCWVWVVVSCGGDDALFARYGFQLLCPGVCNVAVCRKGLIARAYHVLWRLFVVRRRTLRPFSAPFLWDEAMTIGGGCWWRAGSALWGCGAQGPCG